jgi:hypothetical protein
MTTTKAQRHKNNNKFPRCEGVALTNRKDTMTGWEKIEETK